MDIGLGLFGGFGMVDFAIVNCTARSSVEFITVGSDDCSKLKVNRKGSASSLVICFTVIA